MISVFQLSIKLTFGTNTAAALLEVAGKPFGAKGLVSSMRPRRYHTIPRESIEKLFNEAHDLLNFFVVEFQRVIFVENIFATIVVSITFFYYLLWKILFADKMFIGICDNIRSILSY